MRQNFQGSHLALGERQADPGVGSTLSDAQLKKVATIIGRAQLQRLDGASLEAACSTYSSSPQGAV